MAFLFAVWFSVFSFYVEWRAQYDFRHNKTTYLRNFLMLFIHKHALSPSFVNIREHRILADALEQSQTNICFVSMTTAMSNSAISLITSTWNHYPNSESFVLRQPGNAGIQPTSIRRKSFEAKRQMEHFAFHIVQLRAHWRRNAGDGCYFSLSLNSLAALILSGPKNKPNLFTISTEPPSSERDF